MSHAFAGLQIINPKILLEDFVKDFGECFSLSKIYQYLVCKNQKIKGIELQGKYFHIGDIAAITKTESIINSQ